jgi:hypothetical protein
MARKTGVGPGIVLLLGLTWLMSKCDGGGSSKVPDPIPLSSSPAITALSSQPAEIMFVNTPALNQRSAPGGSVAGKISGGDAVSIHERRGSWVRISPDNSAPLWVSRSHLCAGTGCYRPAPPRNRSSTPARRSRSSYIDDDTCPCSGNRVCIGPRGGRYCITSGGNKRYGGER